MNDPTQAHPEYASQLAELYAKGLARTGFTGYSSLETRAAFVEWLYGLCDQGAIWIIPDENGPVTLAHYDREKDEIVIVVTRDGMERQGYARSILRSLSEKHPSAKVRPVTKGGEAIARSSGFSPSRDDPSIWTTGLQ